MTSHSEESSAEVVVGVDIGGTKIEAVVAERAGGAVEVRRRERVATERDKGYEHILGTAAPFLREFVRASDLDLATVPIGVGMPGNLTRAGDVKNSNTTCLNGRPFRADLSRALGRDLFFDNDANCFALAETKLGAAKAHAKSGVVFGVILGTGVGAGVVFDGRVWSGLQGIAGEWGHHAVFADRDVPCYCGSKGCLERFISGPAVEDDYRRRSSRALSLAEIANIRDRDVHAGAAIETFVDAFGRGLANVVAILDPSIVVLGGGVSNLDLLYDEGVERARRYVFNEDLFTPVLKHELGDSAGVLGAALLAR